MNTDNCSPQGASGILCCFIDSLRASIARVGLVALSILGLGLSSQAAVDNAISQKVWKMFYAVNDAQMYIGGNPANGLNTAWLNADDDGDGATNGAELAAGTNPFLASSVLKTVSMSADETSVTLTFLTLKGKSYVLQSNASMTNAAGWAALVPGVQITGDGTAKTLAAPAAATTTYYRVIVQDLDTDGDGVSDWAEGIAGYNSNLAKTNGVDDDHGSLTTALASSNVVTVTASDLTATQPPDSSTAPTDVASFTINRSGPLTFTAITVPLQKAATAREGVDYETLPKSVTIPAKSYSVTLTLSPRANPALRTNATVTLKVLPGGGFTVGSPSSASVVIYPTESAIGTGFTAEFWDSTATYFSTPPVFPTSAPVVVRTDPTIDFNWINGTPNGNSHLPSADNYSVSWEGYLAPAAGGTYGFQLDADDKARVLLDLNDGNGLRQILENGWDTAATGKFKQSTVFNLAVPSVPANRYRMRVEFVETTGSATCRFQWKVNAANYTNIPSDRVFTNNTNATTGWVANYYPNTTLTAPAVRTQTDSSITNGNNGSWGTGSPDPAIGRDTFFSRWTGSIQPQYSEKYYFETTTNNGVRLWVDNQPIIDHWQDTSFSGTRLGTITLQAGVRYDIRMEHYENGGSAEAHLSWYSDSQPKEIVPSARVYAAGTVPPTVTNALSAVGFVGQPFSFFVTANYAPGTTSFARAHNSGPLPLGLKLNATTGEISGTPKAAGTYNIAVTALSSQSGTGSSVVNIQIFDKGSGITRELWTTGVTGPNLADIPVTSPPTTIDALSSLEDKTVYAGNTGERLRGYFTAPSTGNYYFWIAANNVAELWISNDAEPVNKVRRAYVAAPGTISRKWDAQANQKSPWLSLVGGQKYYLEVIRNCPGGAANANVSVGWFRDPTGTTVSPIANGSGVVPGYVLSVYDYPQIVAAPGTLYATNMAPQGVAMTTATGSASLRLNADNSQAILHFQYNGLGSPRTGYHVHSDPFGANPSQIIFDIDDADKFHPELRTADGGYVWNISAVGTLSAADVVSVIQQGKAYINIHSVNYPSGEIRGNFARVVGSQSPPDAAAYADPGYTDDHTTDAGAARFLNQATFGASPTDVAAVKANGFDAWLTAQLAAPASHMVPEVFANVSSDVFTPYSEFLAFNAWWKMAVTAPDQLRQRVAFALSEILVISAVGPVSDNARALANYYDTLVDFGLSDFRTLLKQVTLTPGMGLYLDMRANDKGNIVTGLHPNENYAREIMQLFSIGLNSLWPDGTLVLDSKGNLVPTYNQAVIQGMSRVLTGWNYWQPLSGTGRLPTNFSPSPDYLAPMVLVPTHHELGSKLVLDNVVLPAAIGYNPPSAPVPGSQADPNVQAFDDYCLADLDKALDSIVNNQTVGPFICRQLIQRLVTSHPTPGYLYRVVQKFNDNGSGVRGDMKAVIRAILMDGEARSSVIAQTWPIFGKQREPLMRITGPIRAFPVTPTGGTYSQSGGGQMTITTVLPHKLSPEQNVWLDFTGNLSQTLPPLPSNNPSTARYAVQSSPAPTSNTFVVNATGLSMTTYSQAPGSKTLTVSTGGPAAASGGKVYLKFTTASAGESQPANGIYQVTGNPTNESFTVTVATTPASGTANRTGGVLVPKLGGGFSASNEGATPTVKLSTDVNHNLVVGVHVWIDFPAGQLADSEFAVATVTDEDHFTVTGSSLGNFTNNNTTIYPLVAPPSIRSGTVQINQSTFRVGSSDTELAESPLNSPTVFNFYSPDYKYPGTLATNGVTTPEFQLTTDTNVVTLTNAISTTVLASSNPNGLCGFRDGSSLRMDLSPYMTPAATSDAAVPALLNQLSALLAGGPLRPGSRKAIVTFVANTTNFPYTTTGTGPTNTQMRDRVRAIVHLIITSAEYAVQR